MSTNAVAIPSPTPWRVSRLRIDTFSALMRAKREMGAGKTIIIDGDDRELSYKDIVQASFGLGSALKAGTKVGENVGVMLPTGAGAVIAFLCAKRVWPCASDAELLRRAARI